MTRGNIASYLPEVAARQPFQRALVVPAERDADSRRTYRQLTFQQLDALVDRYAWGLQDAGVKRGMRTLMAVKPGFEFIALTFALFKLGAVPVLIDPGMGKDGLFRAIGHVKPEVLIAISKAHAVRVTIGRRVFASVEINVTVGKRWFWGGPTLNDIEQRGLIVGGDKPYECAHTSPTDMAAILFTTGSTGPAKGVVYEHGMFIAQVEALRARFKIGPGDIDLPGFPLFALFSTALGATAVIPDMDPSQPAAVNPALFVESILDQGITYSFGSPAIWRRVTAWAKENGVKLGCLRLVLMAGAPVPPELFAAVRELVRDSCEIVSPYGATECLPATTVTDAQILGEKLGEKTAQGNGICVGQPLPGMQVKIIPISDSPIANMSDTTEVHGGTIGEICFSGPVVTREYYKLPQPTEVAKIHGADGVTWHRMGDVGHFDEMGRIWFCGRKNHRVIGGGDLAGKVWFSVCCEAIFNQHPGVFRSALVGVGLPDYRRPVIMVEPHPEAWPHTPAALKTFTDELLQLGAAHEITKDIKVVLFDPAFPVDFRHNAKIIREELAIRAARQLN